MKYAVIIKAAVIAVFFLSTLYTVSAQRSVTPFSGKLPSEIYLASLFPENSSSGIAANEHSLLLALPPIDENGDGGGDTVGSAPVRECLWLFIFCCLAYGIIMRYAISGRDSRRRKASNMDNPLQAEGAARGGYGSPPPANCVAVQPATGLRERDARTPRVAPGVIHIQGLRP
jgi:hypothetical protein